MGKNKFSKFFFYWALISIPRLITKIQGSKNKVSTLKNGLNLIICKNFYYRKKKFSAAYFQRKNSGRIFLTSRRDHPYNYMKHFVAVQKLKQMESLLLISDFEWLVFCIILIIIIDDLLSPGWKRKRIGERKKSCGVITLIGQKKPRECLGG